MSPLLSLLGLFFQLSTTIRHQPVQHHLSWSSSSFPPSIFHSITVLSNEYFLSICPIHFLCLFFTVYHGYFFSNPCQHFFICNMLCPTDFLHSVQLCHSILCCEYVCQSCSWIMLEATDYSTERS